MEPDKLLFFYHINGFPSYIEEFKKENSGVLPAELKAPASVVEGYLLSYFDLDATKLHHTKKYGYNEEDKSYTFQTDMETIKSSTTQMPMSLSMMKPLGNDIYEFIFFDKVFQPKNSIKLTIQFNSLDNFQYISNEVIPANK